MNRVIHIKSILEAINKNRWHKFNFEDLPESQLLVAMAGQSMINVPSTKKIFIIGGCSDNHEFDRILTIDYSNEPWKIEPQAGLTMDMPSGRFDFFTGLTQDEKRIWIFGGGQFFSTRNDVCAIDTEELKLYPCQPVEEGRGAAALECGPSVRTQGNNSALVVLDGVEHIVVFGGGNLLEQRLTDRNLYLFNTATSKWKIFEIERGSDRPRASQGHSMFAIGTVVYIFGGFNDPEFYEDMFKIDLKKDNRWTPLPTSRSETWGRVNFTYPCSRAAHAVTVCNGMMYMFGGVNKQGALADFWKYNPERNEWILLNNGKNVNDPGPSNRFLPGMTSLKVKIGNDERAFILVYGGKNRETSDEFWAYAL